MTDAKTFLTALCEHLPEDHQIGLWSLPNRTGQWFADADAALSYLMQMDLDEQDAYIHVGIAPPGFSKARAESADLVGRLGVVADLDLSHDRTQQLLDRAGLEPTLLVASGHGYHGWWLFDEPVLYDGPEAMYDREDVEALAYDWIRTLRAHARDLGITEKLDGVFDLARILRVPGTQNNKHAVQAPVELLDGPGARYSPSEIGEYLLEEERLAVEPAAEPAAVGELLLRADAVPPSDKFTVLLTNHEGFASTWKHERDDELADSSASGYDMALANIAAGAGWDEQEICNLLIAHRRAQNENLNLRQDYHTRTIGKAFAHKRQEEIMEGEPPATEEDREEGLRQLREMLDVPLADIMYLDGEEPLYRFDFDDRGMVQMSAEQVRSRKIWDKKVFATTRLPPRVPSGKGAEETWRKICKAFGALSHQLEVGDEATVDSETRAILLGYIQRNGPEHVQPGEAVEDEELPFRRESRLWVRPDHLRKHARQVMDLRIPRSELMQRLRVLGAENKVIHIRFSDDTTTSRSFWGIPEAVLGEGSDG